jgi:ankyrin repeat protein
LCRFRRAAFWTYAIAASKGNDRIIEQLLSRNADPTITDLTGKAAMTYAAVRGFAEVVRRLLDAGVDAKAALRQRSDRTYVGRGV